MTRPIKIMSVILTTILLTLPASRVFSGTIGGYDVTKLSASTLEIVKEKGIVTDKKASDLEKLITTQPADLLSEGTSIIDFYNKLGEIFISKGIATKADIEKSTEAATQSGGVKIGGMNLVVLGASYLNLLIDKDLLTQDGAQQVLDHARSSTF